MWQVIIDNLIFEIVELGLRQVLMLPNISRPSSAYTRYVSTTLRSRSNKPRVVVTTIGIHLQTLEQTSPCKYLYLTIRIILWLEILQHHVALYERMRFPGGNLYVTRYDFWLLIIINGWKYNKNCWSFIEWDFVDGISQKFCVYECLLFKIHADV